MAQVHGDVPAYEQGEAWSETSGFTDQFDEMMTAPEDPGAYDFSDIALGENEEWNSKTETLARGWLHQLGAGEPEAKAFAKRFDEFRNLDADALERMAVETGGLAPSNGVQRMTRIVIVALVVSVPQTANQSSHYCCFATLA